jgi:hypothetical protein
MIQSFFIATTTTIMQYWNSWYRIQHWTQWNLHYVWMQRWGLPSTFATELQGNPSIIVTAIWAKQTVLNNQRSLLCNSKFPTPDHKTAQVKMTSKLAYEVYELEQQWLKIICCSILLFSIQANPSPLQSPNSVGPTTTANHVAATHWFI